MTETTDLNAILREYLQDSLKHDLEMRLDRPPGSAVYAHWWEPGDKQTAVEADLWAIRNARDSLKRDLAENNPLEMADYAQELAQKYDLPKELLGPLTYGLVEAAIRRWEVAERRTLGTEPLVLGAITEPTGEQITSAPIVTPRQVEGLRTGEAALPAASSLVDTFGNWGLQSGGWRQGGKSQAETSLRLFIEIGSVPGRGGLLEFITV